MARKRYSDEHQSRAITSTHLHQNNASEPCFLTPFAKIYWHSSRGLRQDDDHIYQATFYIREQSFKGRALQCTS